MTTATPVPIAHVAVVETNVFGAVAHHAACTVTGCRWVTERLDGAPDRPHGNVLRWATAHAAKHTDAQDRLDASTA